MTSSRTSIYLPLVLLLFAPSLHCTCAEEHSVANEINSPGHDAHAKHPTESRNNSPSLPPFPPAHPPSLLSDFPPPQQQEQSKKSDQKGHNVNVTDHVTPEHHVTPPSDSFRPLAPIEDQLPGDHLRNGSGDHASGTVTSVAEIGDDSSAVTHPGSSHPTRPGPLPPPGHTPPPGPFPPPGHVDHSSSLNRSPKELLVLTESEHLPTPTSHGDGAEEPVGLTTVGAEIANANTWISLENDIASGFPKVTSDSTTVTSAPVNSTLGPAQRSSGDRSPDGEVVTPPASADPGQSFIGSSLFQPSILDIPQPVVSNNGAANTTATAPDDEEVTSASSHDIDASLTKGAEPTTRRRKGNRKSQRQRQRSLSPSASAENSTTTASVSGGDTTTQSTNSTTGATSTAGNHHPDTISEADILAFPPSQMPNGQQDVHHFGQWPPPNPFGHPMDSHGVEFPQTNGGGLDQWLESHSTGSQSQFAPMFPPTGPHQQPGLDAAFFPMTNENETVSNGSNPSGTDNLFPIFHMPAGAHHPDERFPDSFHTSADGRMGDPFYDVHGSRSGHPAAGERPPHPGPPDFIVPSFLNPVDRSPPSGNPFTPQSSSFPGISNPASGIQVTNDMAASATGSSISPLATSTKAINAAESGPNFGDSPMSFQSPTSARSVTETTAASLTGETTSSVGDLAGTSISTLRSSNGSSPVVDGPLANVSSTVLVNTAQTTVTKRQLVAEATNEQTTRGSAEVGVRPTEGQPLRRLHQRSTAARPTGDSSVSIILLILCHLVWGGRHAQ